MRWKFKYELVKLPKNMYPNQFRVAQRKKILALRGGSSSASATSSTLPRPAVTPKASAPDWSALGARPKDSSYKIPKSKVKEPIVVPVSVHTRKAPVDEVENQAQVPLQMLAVCNATEYTSVEYRSQTQLSRPE